MDYYMPFWTDLIVQVTSDVQIGIDAFESTNRPACFFHHFIRNDHPRASNP